MFIQNVNNNRKKTLFIFSFFVFIILSAVFAYNLKFSSASIDCCYHECNLTDPKKCIGDIIYECQSDCDADLYQDWCEIEDCSATSQTCVDGVCVGGSPTCSDNTPYNTCSTNTGAPWYCNNSGSLIENCGNCGCTGSWICGPNNTFCCDNQCNGICSPSGCTVAYDPDCGCQDNNGCCGIGCNDINDNDCSLGSGDYDFYLIHDGLERFYKAHIPLSYNRDNSTPVILAFHGGGGNADGMKTYYNFIEESENKGYIVVFPNGACRPINCPNIATWNAGTCCSYAVESNSDDVGFVRKILEDIKIKFNIDETRIYATGMSNGGMFSYRLACEMSDKFAAIAAVAGTENILLCNPSRSMPVFHIHALNDGHVYFDGGCSNCSVNSGLDYISVNETIDRWVLRNNCNPAPNRVLEIEGVDGVYCDEYAGCDNGVKVKICATQDGGHSWPSGQKPRPAADTPTTVIDATKMIWEFFRASSCNDTCASLNYECGIQTVCGSPTDCGNCVLPEVCNTSGQCAVPTCVEDWACAVWSACVSGIQTRTCTDNNSCGTINDKPDEMQSCLSIAITDPNDGAKFSVDMPVMFDVIAIGGAEPYNYLWRDNGTPFGDNGPHQMFIPGSATEGFHTILVRVRDANNAIANDSITIEILPAGTLTASINMWQTEFVRDPMMQANFNVNAQGGTAPYTFVWNSNIQGDFSTEQWPSIDVSSWALGTHHITVTVTDNNSNIATDTIDVNIVEILVDINSPFDGQAFIFGENVNFGVMVLGGIMPYNYQWISSRDGDITPAEEPKDWLQKDDLSEGAHTITLTVADSSATPIIVSKQIHITINPAPALNASIDFPADNSTYVQGDDISFQASISGGVWSYTYNWSSNLDGQISSGKDFIKNNLSVGNHVVTFQVDDNSGQTATEIINLIVTDPNPITADITLPNNGDSFYAGDSVVCFTADISGGVTPYIYQWSSNIDNNISDKDEFCATNLAQGNHTITLNITDQNNNTQSDTINITLNPEPNFANTKNMARYSSKEAFLISDQNWQDVLSLTPIAVWQGNKYPMLVYHEESNIDIDSTIHFMQMYEPDHLTTIGTMHWRVNPLLIGAQPTGANLNAGDISNINTSDYLSYWNTINSIVVVDHDNYQAGLMASVFASYKNAPIIFVNSANLAAYQSLINGKVVYTVGSLDAATQSYIDGNAGNVINYDLKGLQMWYIQKTNTDKIILVDSDDLNNDYFEGFGLDQYNTDKGGVIYTLLNKLSLAAPYLASGKQEIILLNENISDLDDILILDNVKNLFFPITPQYVTIMASHDMVPDTFSPNYCRIAGVSTADTFSYSARSLFYNELFDKIYPATLYNKFHISADLSCSPASVKSISNNILLYDRLFDQFDYPFSVLEDKQFNIYSSHGSQFGWGCSVFKGPQGLNYNNIPSLKLSWGTGASCLTGAFAGTKSFSYNWLRQGGIAYWGARRNIYGSEMQYAHTWPFNLWRDNSSIDLDYMRANTPGPFLMYGDATLIPVYRGGTNELPFPTLTIGDGAIFGQREITVHLTQSVYLSCNSYDRDGDVTLLELDFEGDNIYDQVVNNNDNIEHVFPLGTYKPQCRITDNDGGQAITFVIVNVIP